MPLHNSSKDKQQKILKLDSFGSNNYCNNKPKEYKENTNIYTILASEEDNDIEIINN